MSTQNSLLTRRQNEYLRLKEYIKKMPNKIRIVETRGNPPYVYYVETLIPTYVELRSNDIKRYEGPLRFQMILAEDHPIHKVLVFFRGIIPFSPNIKATDSLKGAVCYLSSWRPDYWWLDKITHRVLEIITFSRYSLEKHSFNPQAASFIRNNLNKGLFPTTKLATISDDVDQQEELCKAIEIL